MTPVAQFPVARHYLRIDNRLVHILAGGRGPAVLMLHTLPGEALELRALATAVAERCAVVAPDLPGYGLSDALPGAPSTGRYVTHLQGVLDALRIGKVMVFARQESATLAVAMARRLPERVISLVLEDPWDISPDDAGALPDWTSYSAVESSGAHLLRIWDAVRRRHVFRPFHRATLRTRRICDMPSEEALGAEYLSWLRAGANALTGLRAMAEPTLAAIWDGRACPTIVLARAATEIHAHYATLRTIQLRDEHPGRLGALLADLAHAAAGEFSDPVVASVVCSSGNGFTRRFVRVGAGEIHVQCRSSGGGRPVLALHDPAGTSELVLPFCSTMGADRPVIAVDLAGNGESDPICGDRASTLLDHAEVLAQLLRNLGVDKVDVIGRYSGGPIGMELGIARPDLVSHIVVAGVAIYSADEASRLLERYTPSVRPRADGSHLVRAWHVMQSQALFWPWFDQTRNGIIGAEPQLSPALIHQRVFDLLRCGDRYRQSYAALWTYPLISRLAKLSVPVLLCAPRWDPLFPHLARAAVASARCQSAVLPDRFADWPSVVEPFLDRIHGRGVATCLE